MKTIIATLIAAVLAVCATVWPPATTADTTPAIEPPPAVAAETAPVEPQAEEPIAQQKLSELTSAPDPEQKPEQQAEPTPTPVPQEEIVEKIEELQPTTEAVERSSWRYFFSAELQKVSLARSVHKIVSRPGNAVHGPFGRGKFRIRGTVWALPFPHPVCMRAKPTPLFQRLKSSRRKEWRHYDTTPATNARSAGVSRVLHWRFFQLSKIRLTLII